MAASAQAAPATSGLAAASALAPVPADAPIPGGAVRIGTVPSSAVLHVDVVLAPRDPAALSKYATEVSTPGSPMYHDYLPAGAFPSVFGPTRAAIASVSSALRTLGLHPGAISGNHLSVPVTATAAAIQNAFQTTLATYRLPGGRTGFRNTSAPRLPAAAAAHVQAIVGLDSLVQMQPLIARPSFGGVGARSRREARPAVPSGDPTGGPQPCPAAVSEQASLNSGTSWVFTEDQLAYSYEFSPLYHAGDFGQGVTVGIVEFGEPNLPSDIAAYQSCYDTHVPVSYQAVDGFNGHGAGEGEAALDIENVAVLAPRSNIVVYRGPNSEAGQYDVYGTVAIQDRARVESVSYGGCEKYYPASLAGALNVIFEQNAVQGQTVVVSSGDQGSEGCFLDDHKANELSAEFPASDPWVLSVGGTSIVNSSPVQRNFEVVWNDGYDGQGAGGGGESTFFAEPSYQKAFGVSSGGARGVPDVSADADAETGYLMWHNDAWFPVGGTSAAAPLWAALLAMTDAKCASSPVGFANPTVYFTASPAVKAIVLNDVVTSSKYPSNVNNNFTNWQPGHQYPVLTGYDLATGLGTPVGGTLATQLCKYSAQPKGYRLATAEGQVYSFNAPSHGSVTGRLASKVVGIADDPSTNGYWLVTAKGHVYAFGAPGHGSVSGRLAAPVVGIAADKSGSGYWLVTAKGHVYAFGAPNHGSVKGSLSSSVVGITTDPVTGGYWIATASGKVYAFDAGSYSSRKLSKVTAIAADPLHQGYWLVTAKGKVYGFNVSSHGSMPVGNLFGNVIGIAGDGASGGYWLTTTLGNVAGFLAALHGQHPGQSSKDPIVGIAGTH